jgi:lysozyme
MKKRYELKIKHEEGLSLTVYSDTVNVLTWGYGHNLNNPIPPQVLRTMINVGMREGAEQLLTMDIIEVMNNLSDNFPWWVKMPDKAKIALVDLCFNLGIVRLKKFKVTLGYLERGDYKRASINLVKSKYAKQVPNRAERNRILLSTAV